MKKQTEFIVAKFGIGMHYIMLDDSVIAPLTKNNNKRVVCTINKTLDFHCAIMHNKEGGNFINIGLAICKKLKIKEGSTITATFKIDESAYQFEIPEELSEVLATDEKASKIFHALTAGNQRGLIYLVAQVKSSDKKIERALKIAECIKTGITSPRLAMK